MILDIQEGNYQPDVLTGKINTLSLPLEFRIEKTKDGWLDNRMMKVSFVKDNLIYFFNEVVPQEIAQIDGNLLLDGKEISFLDLLETLKAKNNYQPQTFYAKSK